MSGGVIWALVAAVGFAFLQVSNRKVNQQLDAFRTAFGLLLAAELVLLCRMLALGTFEVVSDLTVTAAVYFFLAGFLHFVGGWTLLGLSQQRIGVARTGALVSAAPVIGTLVAAIWLDEPLTGLVIGGVVLATGGVWLISSSGGGGTDRRWRRPWLALTVATIWGTTPLWIRRGLREFDHPVEGLTIGLGLSVIAYAVLLTLARRWSRGALPASALRWMLVGGIAGATAVAAQWLSYHLTSIAAAITVQQLSVLFVLALVPMMFREPFERMDLQVILGAFALVSGAMLVVMS